MSPYKNLCLYTDIFPYGNGEEYLETEIKYLSEKFENIFIFTRRKSNKKRPLPINVSAITLDFSDYSLLKALSPFPFWLFRVLNNLKTKPINALSTILRTNYQSKILLQYLKKQNILDNTLHYTYWFNDWSLNLAVLKFNKRITNFISRAHRFDLYENLHPDKRIAFQKFRISQVKQLFIISVNGLDYIIKLYPNQKNKFSLAYLGTICKADSHAKKKHKNDKILIVSCSRVTEVKRVNRIIDLISSLNNPNIKWIHFGDGFLLDECITYAREKFNTSIEWKFRGMTSNAEILNFYHTNFVHLFVNLSTSEGLPVSIMEAISAGIPVLATDVGGTSEIVNNQTGKLVPVDASIEELRIAVNDILQTKSQSIPTRKDIRKYWNTYFNAENNYTEFASTISNLQF